MSSSQSDLADLFLDLVDLDAEARAERLAAVEDDALRADLAALLAADVEADARLGRLDRLAPPLGDGIGVGIRVGAVQVLEEIGRGGMGVVYRGHDQRLGRDVAVKVLPRVLSADPEARARLEAEARAASALDHPNVCTVHALDETPDGGLALVMAYYPGETLKARLARGPLAPDEAGIVIRQVAAGLAAAHAAGVVHRDVKPSNVLLGADGVVRVLDFGIARSLGSDLTATGATVGTAAYMAPEQTRGARADARADVWALGVVLHEMLTGERPFRGRGDALVHAIRHDPPLPLPDATPPTLRRAVAAALAKAPGARPADASAFSSVLSAEPPASVPRWRRWASLGLVAVLAVAVGLWMSRPRPALPDDVFVIAVAPFVAVGEGAAAEADVMQALVRRELDGVVGDEAGVRVVEASGPAPRSTAQAVALGEASGAHLVVWGEAVALRGEVEIRPALARAVLFEAMGEVVGGTSPSALLADLSGGDQLALRRTKAAEVGDLALHIAAHYRVGRGDLAGATALLDRVRQPSSATTSLRGWIAMLRKDFPAGTAHFQAAVAADSTAPFPWMGVGVSLLEQGRPVEAEAALRDGLAVVPDHPGLLAMLAWSLGYQGRSDESVAAAQAATRAAPDSQMNRLVLGWAHFMARDADASVAAFTDLIERSTSPHEAAMGSYGIAVVEEARGRLDAAESAVRAALRLDSSGVDRRLLLGQIALARDDLPLAAQTYGALARRPLPPDVAAQVPLVLAYVRARLGRPSAPGLRAVLDTSAADGLMVPLVRFALGQASEAEVLAAAAEPMPALGYGWEYEAHLHLGRVYEAGVGTVPTDRARAVAHYREALGRFRYAGHTSQATYALRRLDVE